MSVAVANQSIETPEPAKSMGRIIFEQFFEHRMAVIGLMVILAFCAVALGADVIASMMGMDQNSQDILNRFGPWDSEHWLGTDEAGRDVFLRLVYGTRISMLVALLVAFFSGAVGVLIGSIAGYYGGFLDSMLMRFTDSMLALPSIPLLIIFSSVDSSKIPFLDAMDPSTASIFKMVIVLVAFSWMQQARLIRGEILAIKEQEFVLAAQTSGLSNAKIIIKELLPNVMSPVIVSVTLNVGQSILSESALSFLGLGIQPPTPTWGNMLNNAQEIIYSAPMLAVIPGLLILAVVVSFNFLGDGLQEAMDPKAIRR
jgi:peptide/nickel transport system permease protein